MEHAWLDSLSEDWVSQPRSDDSLAQMDPAPNPDFENRRSSIFMKRGSGSRIPRPNGTPCANDNSGNVLAERSLSYINMTAPRRDQRRDSAGSSRPQREKSRYLSRSGSSGTTSSVVHNTVNQRSPSASPSKKGSTPEWKRRLVYGNLEYGEQRDLFCSAAADGLEGIFKPPPPQDAEDPFVEGDSHPNETTLPSSPPVFRPPPHFDENEFPDDEFEAAPADVTPSPSPRKGYKEIHDLLDENSVMVESSDEFDIHQDTFQDEEYPANERYPAEERYNAHEEYHTDEYPTHERYRAHEDPDEDRYPAEERHPVHDEQFVHEENPAHETQPAEEEHRPAENPPSNSAPPPALKPHDVLQPPQDESRKTSGQSVVNNEYFSPIYLSVHDTGDGKVGFEPMELPADQLRDRLEKVQEDRMLLNSTLGEDAAQDVQTDSYAIAANVDSTEDYMRNGGFLNLRRGGDSADNSFRYRLLSPSLGNDSSEMLPDQSLQASTPKQFPTVRNGLGGQPRTFDGSPLLPRAPYPSPEKLMPRPHTSGGSPLKLFGPYDTFTNQTLMRRISQFEEAMSDPPSDKSFETNPFRSSVDATNRRGHPLSQERTQEDRSVSHFGDGDLEGYEFGGNVPNISVDESRLDDNLNISQRENIPPPFSSTHDSSPPDSSHLVIHRQRQKSGGPLASSQNSQSILGARLNVSDAQVYLGTPKRMISSEMKRPRTSPTKDPTPKRRRTLHKTDIAYGREYESAGVDAVQTTHQQMQAAMEKRRRDALFGDAQQVAEPDVLTHRQVLRPRTPTPSQRSSLQRDAVPSYGDLSVGGKPKRSPLRNTHSSGRQSAASGETDRKPSIKTQDFLDEAAQIMAMIRNQVRPTNLASVQETDEHAAEGGDHGDDDSYEEPFSRPPSRDGAPVSRVPARQEDPEILDRLKKYQEMSDMGDVITSSLRSMSLAREAILETREMEREVRGTARTNLGAGDEEFSDPPNIRISQGSAESNATNTGVAFPTVSSAGTNRTSSSRTSECKRTIAPQSVSHLIPDQVGSMYLDRNENRWVKNKARAARRMSDTLRDESEDDPFASIPDLSVDMTEEMRNLKIAKEREQLAAEELGQMASESPMGSPPGRVQGYATLTPDQDADDADSLARDEISKLEVKAASSPAREEEVEREISIDEGRHTPLAKRRNLTISFSSPVASFIRDVLPEDLNELSEDEDYTPDLPGEQGHTLSGKGTWQRPSPVNRRKGSRGYVRQPSGGRVSFLRRTVSRIEEQDEESTPADLEAEDRQLSLLGNTSALHATPAPRRRSLSFVLKGNAGEADSSVIGQNVGNLSLSPLSEFTMHNMDRTYGLEVSYVMDRRHLVSGDGSRKVMSLGIRELVDRLTEAEPEEPFWDGLSALDLRDKRLSSLHKLDEFCGALVSLDASGNALTHLDGVPSGVRQLKACGNMLSELTSWDHLSNLQYVDVSGNDLRSLSGLKHLVHLRSVRADDNLLTGLDGIDELDGLLSLRARNNQIEELDFEGTGLQRLSELDVGGNKITSVRNIECLSSLATLKLQRNQLESFNCTGAFPSLRYLDLSDNALHALDLTRVPKLRLLHADRNKLTSISGLSHARHIDSLSLREQRGEQPLDVPAILSTAYEVRKLFLSGNYVGALEPRIDMLNLQLLELASCGLRALPAGMGQLMPNLRSLNICFNAVTELGPLRFVPRLKRLLAAGNRLADGTGIMSVVGEFPHLREVDFRDNPLTLGFYPPCQVLVSTESEVLQSVEGFRLLHADAGRDGRFRGRLDEATRLRRRLYEVIFAAGCVKLRILDGLELRRGEVLGRDEAMDKLVQEGLIPGEGHEDVPEVVEEGDAVKTEVAKDEGVKGEVGKDDVAKEERIEDKEAPVEQAHDEGNQSMEEKSASETEVESCAQEHGDDEGDTSRWPAEDSFA